MAGLKEKFDKGNVKIKEELASKQPTPPVSNTATQPVPETEKKIEAPPIPKAEEKVVPPKEEEKKVETPVSEDSLQKFLRENNLSSINELKNKITPQRQKSPDEEEMEVVEYAVKNGEMKMGDYVKAKSLKDLKDADVVFNDLADKMKAKNKNVTPEQIQNRYDKLYGEKYLDEDGMTEKVRYDQDDISDAAENLRKNAFAPFNQAKQKLQSFQQQKNTESRINDEFESFSKGLTSKLSIQIDDKTNFDYDLDQKEIDEVFIPHLRSQYLQVRLSNQDKPIEEMQNYLKWQFENNIITNKFKNMMNSFAGKKVNAERVDTVKKLENPIELPSQPSESGKPAVDMRAQANKFGKFLNNMR